MKHELRRAFERARDTYPDAALVQKTVAGNLAATIPPGRWDPILEIGSGGGFLHRMLQKHSVTGPYVSLDLTRSMLQMTETGDGTPHLMVQADGESPPFRDRSFHLLVSSSTLQWFQRPQHSIPALLALLRHGGIFAFSLFVEGTLGELSESSRRTGFGSIHPLKPAGYYTDLLASLPDITFRAKRSRETLLFPSVRAVLQNLKQTGAVYTEQKHAVSRSCFAAFIRDYEERFEQNGRIPATYEVLTLHGTRA